MRGLMVPGMILAVLLFSGWNQFPISDWTALGRHGEDLMFLAEKGPEEGFRLQDIYQR